MAEIKQIKVGSTTYDIRDTSKAPLASPALTGTPTAPTAANGTNTTQIATTAFVQNAFKANDAMIFKGTIGSSGATVTALPATHYQGWTYKVATAGSYAGVNCEIGDMIICVTDGTAANNAHWVVIQSNIDGAVTGPTSSVDARVAVFNGTSGKVIKDSGFTISKSVPSDAKFTDTTYTGSNGVSISGTTISNSGVRSIATGTSNGTISVNTNGTSANVAVKGLGSAAYINDAPKDGKYYARKDNAWTVVADSSGSTTSTIPWGNITGTLSNQTDLQTALNGKAASSHTHSYLPLSGGTVTGTIYVKNADADVTVAPSTTLERIVGFNDKNNKLFAYMSGLLSTSTSSLYLCARHYKSDSSRVDNYLRLLSAPDGTKTIEVSDPAAWRTALGLGSAATTASTAYATSSHDHNKGTVKPNCIEFNPTSNTAAHGGFIDFHYNQSTADYTSRIIEQTSGVLSVVGGLNVSGTVTLTKTTDASATANNSPALILGGAVTAPHLELDANEIMAKNTATTTAPLYLNAGGGRVSLGADLGINNDAVVLQYNSTDLSLDFVFA